MGAPRTLLAAACLLAALAPLAGCGGSGDDGSEGHHAETAESRPAPPASAFPATAGRTLRQLVKQEADSSTIDLPGELKVEPEAEAFYPGVNRYPFGLAEKKGKEIDDAEVALYYAKVPSAAGRRSKQGVKGAAAKASQQALDQPAVGPFPAQIETLATKPQFRSQTTLDDPESASVVYSAPLDLEKGSYRVEALVKQGDEVGSALLPSVNVGEFDKIPEVGERPPAISTPTAKEAGGDLSKITTREPPDTQNEADFAKVLGKEPILLLFATPQFCQSRVCGPVVDVAEQAKAKYGKDASFIHMEIYNDNDPAKGVRPQVRAFHLPTEPWLFAIDREGVIAATVEGAFGTELIDQTVQKAVGR